MSSSTSAPRRAHTGWSEQENQLLWDAVHAAEKSKRPLKEVFSEVAHATGRQPNSIRNYYYTVAKARGEGAWRAVSFTPFEEDETRKLIKNVLIAVTNGESVRSCVRRESGGDRTLMLRYQNKYRAILKSRPELIGELIDELNGEGIEAANPYDRMMSRKRRFDAAWLQHSAESDAYAVSFSSLGPEAAPMIRGFKRMLSKHADLMVANRTLTEENDRLKVQVELLTDEMTRRDETLDRAQGARFKKENT